MEREECREFGGPLLQCWSRVCFNAMDGDLLETRGSKKGQIGPMIRFRVSFQWHE